MKDKPNKKSKPFFVKGKLGSHYVIPEEFRTVIFNKDDWQKALEEMLTKIKDNE